MRRLHRSLWPLVFSLGVWVAPALAQVPQAPGTTYNSSFGAVATIHPMATKAAGQALENGGTAIDAAIAATLTLGVVDGFNSGLGGGLFALVRYADGEIQAIDAREQAPEAATEDLFIRDGKPVKDLSRTGALAAGIPGAVLALEHLHKRGGKLPLAAHYLKAAVLADRGFPITKHYAARIQRTEESLRKFPESASIFLDSNGQPWPAGHVLKQPDLATSYLQIAKQGSQWFYRGEFAQKAEQWMLANKGIIRASDFANYALKMRSPIVSEFAGHTFVGFPPPSSGGIHVAQMLHMLQQLDFGNLNAVDQAHWLAEVMKLAFSDRSRWLGDPDFVDIPEGLLNENYLNQRFKLIGPEQAATDIKPGQPEQLAKPGHSQVDLLKHTSHISVADAQGNWVSLTSSLNTSFGSKVTVPGTGILLNNQMDDFAADPGTANIYGLVQGSANAVAPGKRPLSSMTPALVLKNNQPVLAVGAAGGPLIINQVVQIIARHVLGKMPLDEALNYPRLHHQWSPQTLFVESSFPSELRQGLQAKGHELDDLFFEGSSNAVGWQNNQWMAVSEPRMVQRNEVQE